MIAYCSDRVVFLKDLECEVKATSWAGLRTTVPLTCRAGFWAATRLVREPCPQNPQTIAPYSCNRREYTDGPRASSLQASGQYSLGKEQYQTDEPSSPLALVVVLRGVRVGI